MQGGAKIFFAAFPINGSWTVLRWEGISGLCQIFFPLERCLLYGQVCNKFFLFTPGPPHWISAPSDTSKRNLFLGACILLGHRLSGLHK